MQDLLAQKDILFAKQAQSRTNLFYAWHQMHGKNPKNPIEAQAVLAHVQHRCLSSLIALS